MKEQSIDDLIKKNRKKELVAIYKFITTCDVVELATLIEEIRCVHDNFFAFNPHTKLFCKVENISINGDCVQLNLDDYQ